MRSPNNGARLRAGSSSLARMSALRAPALSLNPPALGEAAYHCQQAAEKLVKDLLVAAAVAFRKTHDIDERAASGGSPGSSALAVLATKIRGALSTADGAAEGHCRPLVHAGSGHHSNRQSLPQEGILKVSHDRP
jgi:hypothetical protein